MGRCGLATPILWPLYRVTDDVVHPVCGDEEYPVCVLRARGYLQRLVLSECVRDLRESLLGFLQAFVDSIHNPSEGRGLVNARSGTWGLSASCSGTLHSFLLVRLLARVNQPDHHAIGHALILLVYVGLCDSNHSKNER